MLKVIFKAFEVGNRCFVYSRTQGESKLGGVEILDRQRIQNVFSCGEGSRFLLLSMTLRIFDIFGSDRAEARSV